MSFENNLILKRKMMDKELSSLYQYGAEVFGNEEKFIVWLESKNIALGGKKPKEMLDTNLNINLLKDELVRIEYGIFA